jgi:outer membrane beta-barrel protein
VGAEVTRAVIRAVIQSMNRFALAAIFCCVAQTAAADCVDEEARARLASDKRLRRAGEERDFVQAGRHELTLSAGYYAPALYDGTFLVQAGYAYHVTESLAVEASFGFTRLHSSAAARLEADRGVAVLPDQDRTFLGFADLAWAPLHGKAQLFSSLILHFDLYGSLGAGIVDNAASLGVAGRAGLGGKVYFGRGISVRLDVYDHLYREQVLSTSQIVNDISVSLGVSLYLPWSQ